MISFHVLNLNFESGSIECRIWFTVLPLNRRQALKSFARFAAAVSSFSAFDGLSPEAAFAVGQEIHKHLPPKGSAETTSQGLLLFDPHQNATVIVISELIIPQSHTPGAKAARVNEFIDVLLASRPKSEQDKFLEGLNWLDKRSQELFGHSFVDCLSRAAKGCPDPNQCCQFS